MKSKKFLAILIAILSILYLFSGCGGASTGDLSAEKQQECIKNTVVFFSFEKQGDNFPEGFSESIYQMYETANHSVKNYLLKQSKSRLLMQTEILPAVDGQVVVSDKSIDYYRPRYKWYTNKYIEINELGYDNRYFNKEGQAVKPNSQNSLLHIDWIYREQLLIREILSKIELPSDYKGDLNGDAILDSLVIIADCEVDAEWGDILWPHAGSCFSFSSLENVTSYFIPNPEKYKSLGYARLGSFYVSEYNLLNASLITAKKAGDDCKALSGDEAKLYNIGLLAHESLHLLGLADYYSYEDSAYESVGEFDIMGSTQSLPQNMLAYTRLKLGWLDYDDILYIDKSGSYTLPLSMAEGKVAAKIVLSDYIETGEYFMAELRSASLATADCAYDGGLYGDGLILYRVAYENAFINSTGGTSSSELGNMYGEDEIYVYRMSAKRNKKLSSPLIKTSYAMLANGKTGYTFDLNYYHYDHYGNKDLTKNLNNLVTSTNNSVPSETIISYSDGSNSGIVIKDVMLHKDTQTVTFTVELPKDEDGQNSLISNNAIVKKLPNGAPHVRWQYNGDYEKASVMLIRSTNRLRKKAENNSLNLKRVFKNAPTSSLYEVIDVKSAPIQESALTFDSIKSEALVIVCLENSKGERTYIYAGSVDDSSFTFNEFLFKIFDPVSVIWFTVIFVLVVGGFIALIVMNAKRKKLKRYQLRH